MSSFHSVDVRWRQRGVDMTVLVCWCQVSSELTPSLPGQQPRMRREDWLMVCFSFLFSFVIDFHWNFPFVVEDL